MKKHYSDKDEVLYHVGFAAKALEGATIAVLPGDPGRVEPLAHAVGKNAHFIASHREYTRDTLINKAKYYTDNLGSSVQRNLVLI